MGWFDRGQTETGSASYGLTQSGRYAAEGGGQPSPYNEVLQAMLDGERNTRGISQATRLSDFTVKRALDWLARQGMVTSNEGY